MASEKDGREYLEGHQVEEKIRVALATLLKTKPENPVKALGMLLAKKKVVILCTSEDSMQGHATGAWSEEITGPYYVFIDAGCEVTIASPKGGKIPIDQGSLSAQFKTSNDKRFEETPEDSKKLNNSKPLSQVVASDIDILFLAGGHGTCVDFTGDEVSKMVTQCYSSDKVVGAVCHGPMGLVNATDKAGGPLVKGKKVAAFSNAEEGPSGVNLMDKVPFPLETKLTELGAMYVPSSPWAENAVLDGRLATGQNPQSSVLTAKLCLEAAFR